MKLETLRRVTLIMALVWTIIFLPENGRTQEIDFGQIDSFESAGTGTLHGSAPPKTIIEDGDRHTVLLTILDADTDTKVYWKPLNEVLPRTTTLPGRGVQIFQTDGVFKLEAIGDQARSVKYGYVLLRLKKQ
jgi:hypothetical protein